MGSKSKIAWTDSTWNPVTGCTKESAGCANCYAEGWALRFNSRIEGDASNPETRMNPEPFKPTTHPDRLDIPKKWKRPRIIFMPSLGDPFHPEIPDQFLDQVFDVMENTTRHFYLVLTKRETRMQEYTANRWVADPPANIGLGVTVENQDMLNRRGPTLMRCKAVLRFFSGEPLLSGLDLKPFLSPMGDPFQEGRLVIDRPIDWVIAGGESGTSARECREEWVADMEQQCHEACVPFFFKQTGARWVRGYQHPAGRVSMSESIWKEHRQWPKQLLHLLS